MSLSNYIKRVKSWFKINKVDLIIITMIVLVVLLGVGMWRLNQTKPEKQPIRVEEFR